jgi:hypothetical protein
VSHHARTDAAAPEKCNSVEKTSHCAHYSEAPVGKLPEPEMSYAEQRGSQYQANELAMCLARQQLLQERTKKELFRQRDHPQEPKEGSH